MTQSNIIPEPTVFAPAITATAFQKVFPEILALPDEDTLTVGLDVTAAATTVLGLVPALQALRPEVAELPRFNIRHFDELTTYAHALVHAHALHRSAQIPKAQIAQLGNELTIIRDRLYGNAMSLADNGLLEGGRLRDCKKAIGYRAIASDVILLTEVFKEYWPNIEGKTPIVPGLLSDAANRAAELLNAVSMRAQASETAWREGTDARQGLHPFFSGPTKTCATRSSSSGAKKMTPPGSRRPSSPDAEAAAVLTTQTSRTRTRSQPQRAVGSRHHR